MEDSSRTCEVYDIERCPDHLSDANLGPLGHGTDVSALFPRPPTPIAPTAIPSASELKAMAPRPVSKRNMARRDYYASHRGDYGRYELNRLRRMLSQEKDLAKVSALMKRIEKREVAMGVADEPQPDNESNPQ